MLSISSATAIPTPGSPPLTDRATERTPDYPAETTAKPGANPSPEDTEQAQQIAREVIKLKARDQEVRAHEQAHLSAAGSLAISGASFTFATGPDGQRYAIGGEVSIDTSTVPGDPQATLRKAEAIRRAALAPANPSPQDYRVASKASNMASKAQAELIQQQNAPASGNEPSNDAPRIDLTV